jgi:hypothetical protein
MELGLRGQSVRAYPKDSLKPFDATDWFVERPYAVERVEYNAQTRELLVDVNYGWNTADVDRFRATLAEKYRHAGRATEPKAITVTPLEMSGYSIVLNDGEREYIAFATTKPTSVSSESIGFRVPSGADNLHQRLSDPMTRRSVKVVLRAGYSFDRIVGLTVEKQAINAVWQTLLDSVRPNGNRTGEVLVNRNILQELRKNAVAQILRDVKVYGLAAGEVAAELDKASSVMGSVPVSPVTVPELLAMEESAWMYTLKAIQKDITPDEMNNAISKLKEARNRAEKMTEAAEKVSDYAKDDKLTNDAYYSKARKEMLGVKGGGWGVSVDFHLDKDENDVKKNFSQDIQKMRTYSLNKSNFLKEVQESSSRELEGVMRESRITAKLLDLSRISTAALTAKAGETYCHSRVIGRETVFVDTSVPLAPSPVVVDAIAALQEEAKQLRTKLAQTDAALAQARQTFDGENKALKEQLAATNTKIDDAAKNLDGKITANAKALTSVTAEQAGRIQQLEVKTQFIKIVKDEKGRNFMRIQLNPDMQIDFQYTGNVVVWGMGVLFQTKTYKIP